MAILAAAYVALARDDEQLVAPQLPAGPVPVGGPRAAAAGTLPRPIAIALAACALSFSAVTGIDYVRLDRDRAAVHGRHRRGAGARHAAAADVRAPQDQRLHRQPDPRLGLLHGGEGRVGAAGLRGRALLPDHVPGVSAARADPARPRPVRREVRDAPRRCASSCASSPTTRRARRPGATLWMRFWQQAEPRFSHVLTWAMPPEARPIIPARYRRVFAAGDLEIYARRGDPGRAVSHPDRPLGNTGS